MGNTCTKFDNTESNINTVNIYKYIHTTVQLQCLIESHKLKKKTVKIKLPSSYDWNENLQSILSRIPIKFPIISNMQENQWCLTMNDSTTIIDKYDSNKFSKLLSTAKPTVTLNIVHNPDCKRIIVRFNSDSFTWIPTQSKINNDENIWETNYDSLVNDVCMKYKLNRNHFYLQDIDECDIECAADLISVWKGLEYNAKINTTEILIKARQQIESKQQPKEYIMDNHRKQMAALDTKCANSHVIELPLHQYKNIDIEDAIKYWVFHDVNYQKYLLKTMSVFSSCALSGTLMCSLPINAIKSILEKELLPFMTEKTLDIIINDISQQIQTEKELIKTKTAEELGYIAYNYPLNNVINRINDECDLIDGEKYIKYYKENKNWMEEVSGWDRVDIYQIDAALFKHDTFRKKEIINRVNNISLKDLSDKMIKYIIPHFNLENLHYKIKNGQNIQNFSDMIINMVDEFIENKEEKTTDDYVKNIYYSIAKCFEFDYTKLDSNKISLMSNLDKIGQWVCSNCNNYNFVKL
eukprot:485939_1